ncbi:MarR family winged helix-turn-helix transcriptional regulator [Naumannella cuiyingiana]|uniref:DNA-binding MarR family transcriptional regulator n=1 Tax=Naumannella cuiyingiana TaxID=1347891 RepID=A0A7Z0ILQ6_9ACTN|nr:MarR family transcriptional regulator [Naumannella cuiyingiana]NYI71811.1 DNA-binding MarR family transcriptional regulator [Naumannella cuiyingiana]
MDQVGRLALANERVRATLAKEINLSLHEFNTLLHLDHDGPVTPKDLATRLSITTGSATALVDRMVGAGYVNREPHPADRRSILLRLTPRGTDIVRGVRERYASAAGTAFDGLKPEQIRELERFTAAFADQLRAWKP